MPIAVRRGWPTPTRTPCQNAFLDTVAKLGRVRSTKYQQGAYEMRSEESLHPRADPTGTDLTVGLGVGYFIEGD